MRFENVLDNMAVINTHFLVADYIYSKLCRENINEQWISASYTESDLSATPGSVQSTLRTLGQEFETRYNEVFHQMCDQLHITLNTAQPTFVAIVNELFSDGIRWGRIVALFSFAGCMAEQCIQKEMSTLVDQIIDWVASYINDHLDTWIVEHGGWDGFVTYYEGSPSRKLESPWPSIKTICAVGLLTLGAILAQRT